MQEYCNARVSVIIPTYNRAELIGETLNSVLQQTIPPAEVIIVDDGSHDRTAEVVRRFGSRVRYVRIPNSGQVIATNYGASIATGTHLALCDSDDLWRPDHIQSHLDLRKAFPEVEYSFSNFSVVSGDGKWDTSTKFDTAPKGFWEQHREIVANYWIYRNSLYRRLLHFQPIFPSTTFMSRHFFFYVGGCNVAVNRLPSMDLEMHLRCVSMPPTGVVAKPTVGIRKHTSNFSCDHVTTLLGECEILDYAKTHHALGRDYAPDIINVISRRRLCAFDKAFEEKRFYLVCQIGAHASGQEFNTLRSRVKLLVARLPAPISAALGSCLLFAGSCYRVARQRLAEIHPNGFTVSMC